MTKKLKKFTLAFCAVFTIGLLAFTAQLSAGDRCFGCAGGTYVKYTGKADNAAKKKAAACGCKVKGTAGCPSNKKKILCSVN